LYCNIDGKKEIKKVKKNRNLKFLLNTPLKNILHVTPKSLGNNMIALTMLPYLSSDNMPPLATDHACLHQLP
jgi:hypothetical protein